MLKVIIAIVAIILLTILIVWLIDKFIPKKIKPVINIVLWALIAYLGYITYNSVYDELKFEETKDERYQAVVSRLITIQKAEVAYKEVNGKYTDKYDELISFINTARIPITQRRDSTVLDEEKTKTYNGIEYFKTLVVIDTLDYFSVKDSLFKNVDYNKMMNVFDDKELEIEYLEYAKELPNDTKKQKEFKQLAQNGHKFQLRAGTLDETPVFEASLDKAFILFDQDKNLVDNEKGAVAYDGISGPKISVGSMNEITSAGNWPKNYTTIKKKQ